MELSYDIKDNLCPYERTSITFQVFKSTFVDPFGQDSSRHLIFEKYQQFLSDFSKQITPNFVQWINGSFISNKKNPGDIDFVTIIDHQIFEKKESFIEQKFRLLGAKEKYLVDAYTVRKYPEDHRKYSIYHGELVYWDQKK